MQVKFNSIIRTVVCMAICSLVIPAVKAQVVADTTGYAEVTIIKDKRIDVLGEKMAAYNVSLARSVRSARGYRLMVMSTNDRNLAMQLRSTLMQQYPEHKVYMLYQVPFIKIKMGNFAEKDEAERVKKMLLAQRLITGNIYVLPETIEVRPSPLDEQE